MTHEFDNPTTIRRYVDGELEPAVMQAFERALVDRNDLQQAVAFERALRGRVQHIMEQQDAVAPAELRQSIVRQMQQETHAEVAVAGRIQPGGSTNNVARSQGTSNNFNRANIFAVAATLFLVAGAVLFGIFAPPIDAWRTGDPGQIEMAEYQVAQHLSQAHVTCAYNPDQRAEQLVFSDQGRAMGYLADLLNSPIAAFDLSEAGYTFVAGGDCPLSMNNTNPVGHLIFKREVLGGSEVYASIFLVPTAYGIGLNTPQQFWTEAAPIEECKTLVLKQRDQRFVYFLTACDADDLRMLGTIVHEQLHSQTR